MKKFIAGGALVMMAVGFGGTAFAGEVTGSGRGGPDPTQPGTPGGTLHSKSICAFSGLADGGEGEPAGPGAPPQNWGQIPKAERDILAQEGAHPGDSCNGHTGFLAGGGEEP